MNKITLLFLVIASFAAYTSAAVRPQTKLYFPIPLGPAPAAPAPAPAAPAPAPAAPPAAPEAEEPPPEGEEAPPEGEEAPPEGEEPAAEEPAAEEPAAEEAAPAPAEAPAQMQLNIIPLGQLLGMILTGLFGMMLPIPSG